MEQKECGIVRLKIKYFHGVR